MAAAVRLISGSAEPIRLQERHHLLIHLLHFVNGDVISVQLTSNETCATGNPATSNSITMTVNPNLPVGVSISANPGNTICDGTSVTFTASPVNGGSSPAYQWFNGANPIAGETSSTYTSSTLVNGDVISVPINIQRNLCNR